MSEHEVSKLAVFEGKRIRKTLHEGEWWFVVKDVVLALIESRDPKQYIQRMKKRDPELWKGWVQIVHTLSIVTEGGPQPMLCANTEGIFRLIQSIPSPKAEPFKRWLARVGKERIAVAGRTRKDIEAQTGKPVISGGNFKKLSSRKLKKLKADED